MLDLEMGVGSGVLGVARVPDISDDLTGPDLVAFHDRRVEGRPDATFAVIGPKGVIVEMHVGRGPTVPVLDADVVAREATLSELCDHSVGNGDDRSPSWAYDVRALVTSVTAAGGSPAIRESNFLGQVGEDDEYEAGFLG